MLFSIGVAVFYRIYFAAFILLRSGVWFEKYSVMEPPRPPQFNPQIPTTPNLKDEGGLRQPPGLSYWRRVWWWFDFLILVKLARLRFIAILIAIGLVITQWDTSNSRSLQRPGIAAYLPENWQAPGFPGWFQVFIPQFFPLPSNVARP